MRHGNLVILAGGISSRMRKSISTSLEPELQREAEQKSKAMIGVGERTRPFLDYLLYNAREAGYTDVVIVVGEHDQSFRQYYGSADRGNPFHGLTIGYAIQPIPPGREKPLGTADALHRALLVRDEWQGQVFTVCNSDNLYSSRAMRLLRESPSENAMIDYDRHSLQFEPQRIQGFAVLVKDINGSLVDIVEKPTPEEVVRARDSSGRVGVSMNIFRFLYDWILPCVASVPLHPVRLEKELPTAVMMMIRKHPGCLMTIPLAEQVPDLTHKNDIPVIRDMLAREFPNFSFD